MKLKPSKPLTRGGASLPSGLLDDVRGLIESARSQVARAVDAGLVLRNWSIGARIRRDLLKLRRAEYGERIVQTLSAQLVDEFGPGLGARSLFRMVRFADQFRDPAVVSTLSRQLGWSHFIELIAIDDHLKRDFYAELCRLEGWSVRMLHKKIDGMLYERTALSRKPSKLAALELRRLREEDRVTPDLVFQDPYVLDFLGLKGAWQEKDLEAAILREMEAFILELGQGFAFVARQKRIPVGERNYHLDLLFYQRRLRRLVAVELKLGRFKPEDKGQMELYLRWLDKHDRQSGEGSPLGLILCAGKSHEEVALLQLEDSGIRVAEYLIELPPRRELERRLHDAIRAARARAVFRPATPGRAA